MSIYETNEIVEFIKEHYQRLPNKEIHELLIKKFPNVNFPKKAVHIICSKHRFVRTPDERKVLMARLVETGVKRNATIKQHENKARKPGDIFWGQYGSAKKKQWVVKIGPKKFKQYSKYLWVQHYGKVPNAHKVVWIDETRPLTVDNLQLVKFIKDVIPINGITTWKNEQRRRELIKVAEGRYELYWPYLWRKHHGEIPPGKYVIKIDPFLPTTIENLCLTSHSVFSAGSKNLEDWFVKATLSKRIDWKTLKHLPPLLEGKIESKIIEAQRASLEFKRKIKKAEEDARNPPGGASDNQVEGSSS